MQHLLNVQGMTCGHCERSVTEAVKSIDAKAFVTIDRTAGTVAIESEASHESLAKAIAAEGYEVS